MKSLKKITLNKKDISDTRKNYKPSIVTIILAVIAAALLITYVCLCYYPSYNRNGYRITEAFLALSIIFIVFTFVSVILMVTSKNVSKKKPKYFLVKDNKKQFVIVDKLSSDIEEENLTDGIANTNTTQGLAFKEEQIEKQHNKNVNIVKTFPDFAKFINEYFLNKGYKTEVGSQLVASIATSPVLFLNGGENNDIFIENINGCFNSPKLILDASISESLVNDYALFDAVNTARSFKNSPVFLVIKNLEAEKADQYLLPLKKYFINRNNATIELSNNIVKITNNLYVIISLTNPNAISLVNPELLKHSTTFTFDCKEDVTIGDGNPKPIELDEFNIVYALNRLKNDCYLEEEYWKKVDMVEELLVNAGYPKFDNKTLSYLESYVSICINGTGNQMAALDETMANYILLPALTKCGVQAFKDDTDIITLFNTIFEDDQMLKSKEVIKNFFATHDKEGNLL